LITNINVTDSADFGFFMDWGNDHNVIRHVSVDGAVNRGFSPGSGLNVSVYNVTIRNVN